MRRRLIYMIMLCLCVRALFRFALDLFFIFSICAELEDEKATLLTCLHFPRRTLIAFHLCGVE
jgi:hypothetical protein